MKVNNLEKTLWGNLLFKNISFSLNNGDKVGLVGKNGSGKSTLLKILAGEIPFDFGSINLNYESVQLLKQEIDFNDYNYDVIEYIKKETGLKFLEEKLHDLEENLTDDNMAEYGETLDLFLKLDGYNLENNIKKILTGLKFENSLNKKIGLISGGEKIKVLLCVMLISNSDIMLLDEPTNNLDIEAILWLEKFLKTSSKKMIIVSHDEEFLNNITNKIFELEYDGIIEYNLSYNDYLKSKDLEYQKALDEYNDAIEKKKVLEKQIHKTKQWVDRGLNNKNRNDNDKLSRNYAKERTNTSSIFKLNKKLDELNIPAFEKKEEINFDIGFDNDRGNKDIDLQNLIIGYDDFSNGEYNFSIPFKTRLKINGKNGSGKSTLIKTIIGDIMPLKGRIKVGNAVKFGYISQETFLDKDLSIYEYLTSGLSDIDNGFVFTVLDKFNISYEDKDKKYMLLSSGQRTRVSFAKLALQKVNVLLLDEVTNHLDKEALEVLYDVASNFYGTIIFVSHNRKFEKIIKPNMILDIETGNIIKK